MDSIDRATLLCRLWTPRTKRIRAGNAAPGGSPGHRVDRRQVRFGSLAEQVFPKEVGKGVNPPTVDESSAEQARSKAVQTSLPNDRAGQERSRIGHYFALSNHFALLLREFHPPKNRRNAGRSPDRRFARRIKFDGKIDLLVRSALVNN